MKNALEPLPTKQLVAVKERKPNAAVRVEEPETRRELNAYPWLLGISTGLSVVLCWMYVTKPVIVEATDQVIEDSLSATGNNNVEVLSGLESDNETNATSVVVTDEKSLIPSSSGLPGSLGGGPVDAIAPEGVVTVPTTIADPLTLSGWEETNHKVQHVLQADYGNGSIEKISVDVPVFYQTRTMGWSPTDIAEARELLSRLMVYEANIHKLKEEGDAMLVEWNSLLDRTVPTESLRADSPSLPYNHSIMAGDIPLSGSDPLIKVDQ